MVQEPRHLQGYRAPGELAIPAPAEAPVASSLETGAHGPARGEHAHPGPREYVKIAVILTLITAVEVGIYYVPQRWLSGGYVAALLIVLAIAKFALVIMFYMHLRYDHRIFTGLFVMGLVIAVGATLALMALFRVLVG